MMHALAVAALLTAGCAAAPPPQDPEAAVARLLRERIAAAGDTAPVAGALPATLSRFYSARAWMPAWSRNRAVELVAAVAAASADGLRPADYPLDSIRALLDVPAPYLRSRQKPPLSPKQEEPTRRHNGFDAVV